jgi:hypothetical protein
VVGVLASRAALPGHLVDVDGGLGGGSSGRSAWEKDVSIWPFVSYARV